MALNTFDYDFLNVYNGLQSPSTVHTHSNDMARFFTRYLFQKATSGIKFKLPENFDYTYFLYCLYANGYIGVINTKAYGIIPMCGYVGGEFNMYYNPKIYYTFRPTSDSNIKEEYKIKYSFDKTPLKENEACLLRLTPDYKGISDIVHLYADAMALVWESLGMNVVNTKLAYVFLSKNKTFSESFKKMYDSIQSGNPMVVIDKQLLDEEGNNTWDVFTQNIKNMFITPELLNTLSDLENKFNAEIGIPNNGGQLKKAQISNDEASLNNAGTYSKIEMWCEQLSKDIDFCNKVLNIDINAELRYNRYDDYTEVAENGNISNNERI